MNLKDTEPAFIREVALTPIVGGEFNVGLIVPCPTGCRADTELEGLESSPRKIKWEQLMYSTISVTLL